MRATILLKLPVVVLLAMLATPSLASARNLHQRHHHKIHHDRVSADHGHHSGQATRRRHHSEVAQRRHRDEVSFRQRGEEFSDACPPPDSSLYRYVRAHAGAKRAKFYSGLIAKKASKYHLPSLLVAGIIEQESHFDPQSRLGRARGLMQVNHGHERPGQDLYDPATNVEIGCRILKDYHDWAVAHLPHSASSNDVWHKALTAYNFGPNQVVSRGLMRSRYSRKVLSYWRASSRS